MSALRWFLCTAMLIGLPLIGIGLTNTPVLTYLEFPPLTRYILHATFDWTVFCIIAMLNLTAIVMLAYLLKTAADRSPAAGISPHRRFPVWGWLGAAVMLAGWWLAWTRFEWFAPLQKHTFSMPWVGYILLVNGWCQQRSGSCPITAWPGRFALLWPISALFWWFFEYLNRFVQNWYYVNVEDFGPFEYVGFASLAFATVLPAVSSTQHLLLTWPLLGQGLGRVLPIRMPHPKYTAAAALAAAGCGLVLMSVYPDVLYPLVWCAPVAILTALQTLWGRSTIFSPLVKGDWRMISTAAMAALICGFFWEMWNINSLAQWRYSIPYVDRFHLFAMPLLGYGGYLPFGLECLAATQVVWALAPQPAR